MAKMSIEDFLYMDMGKIIGELIAHPEMTSYKYTTEDDDENEVVKTLEITPAIRKSIAKWCLRELPDLFNY